MLERLTRVTVPLSESEFSMLRGLAMKELRPTKEQARFLLRQALGLTEDVEEKSFQNANTGAESAKTLAGVA